jgi:hypothetical protein
MIPAGAGILVAMTLRVEQKYLQEMQCCFIKLIKQIQQVL